MPSYSLSWRLQLQTIPLIILSLFFLPLSTFVVLLSNARRLLSPINATRRRVRRRASFRPYTILVTGVSTTKGLVLARSFYEAGHDVIGADFELYGISVCGRYSRSLHKFYSLAKPNAKDGLTHYLHHLLTIIQREKVDLWISCSGVVSAIEDAQAKEVIERRTGCVAIQFDVETTSILHDKHSFVQRTRDMGLSVPETHIVTSRTAVHKILHSIAASNKKYILKNVGPNVFQTEVKLLPRRTLSETYNHMSVIPISSSKPWVLQEYIHGPKYCTHALIINNVVKTFVAYPLPEVVIHFEALPSNSSLSFAMLRFTQEFAGRSSPGMTGHLNFTFIVEEQVSEKGLHSTLRAMKCHTGAHPAVVLLSSRSQNLAEAYLSALHTTHMNGNGTAKPTLQLEEEHHGPSHVTHMGMDMYIHENTANNNPMNGRAQQIITPSQKGTHLSKLGHEILNFFSTPLQPNMPTIPPRPSSYIHNILILLQHHLLHLLPVFWTNGGMGGVFTSWDPLPWWWLYQVYWPRVFFLSIWNGGELMERGEEEIG